MSISDPITAWVDTKWTWKASRIFSPPFPLRTLEAPLSSSMKSGRWSAFQLASDKSCLNSSIRRDRSLQRLLSKEAGSLKRSSEDRILDSSKSILEIESLLWQKLSKKSECLMREEETEVTRFLFELLLRYWNKVESPVNLLQSFTLRCIRSLQGASGSNHRDSG